MEPILPITSSLASIPLPQHGGPATSNGQSFDHTLQEFIDSVNELQKESGSLSERFIKGEAVDLHDVMIATEKAKTSFQLLTELRNKALDLYREAMRIQV